MAERASALVFVGLAFCMAQGCDSESAPLRAGSAHHDAGGGTAHALDGGGARTGAGGAASTVSTGLDCKNSLDCAHAPDRRQICDRANGVCVECLARADCGTGTDCYGAHCRAACTSDKDCVSMGLLCDSAAGRCVDCQVDADCPAHEVCLTGACATGSVPDAGGAGQRDGGGHGAGGLPGAGGSRPETGGARSAGGSGVGGSEPSTCTNGKRDGSETDVDCGGPACPPCANGTRCTIGADCSSGSCVAARCSPPPTTCSDKAKNGDESDVDCGGACPACAEYKKCGTGPDCTSLVCSESICQVPTCKDQVHNADETGVDCGGGGACPRCAQGQPCLVGTDCETGVCADKLCAAPSCTDGVKNGTETGIDCGGGCACRIGYSCKAPEDCASRNCVANTTTSSFCRAAATCSNSMKDGTETGVDCGGAACPSCPAGKPCSVNIDCNSGQCVNEVCMPCDVAKCPAQTTPFFFACCTSAGTCGTTVSPDSTFCN